MVSWLSIVLKIVAETKYFQLFPALINFVLSVLYESNERSEINKSISDFISRVEHGLHSI